MVEYSQTNFQLHRYIYHACLHLSCLYHSHIPNSLHLEHVVHFGSNLYTIVHGIYKIHMMLLNFVINKFETKLAIRV